MTHPPRNQTILKDVQRLLRPIMRSEAAEVLGQYMALLTEEDPRHEVQLREQFAHAFNAEKTYIRHHRQEVERDAAMRTAWRDPESMEERFGHE
jgi:hypothetical protein